MKQVLNLIILCYLLSIFRYGIHIVFIKYKL